MEPNETQEQEETKIEPPSYFVSDIRYSEEHVDRTRKEAIQMAKELRAAKVRAAAADANHEAAKLHLEEARERLETWVERNKPKPVEKPEPEETEPESVPEPESVRTLAGAELGNGLDTGFVVDVGGADW